jgi:DNA-binding NarL/FixJ family response regulator
MNQPPLKTLVISSHPLLAQSIVRILLGVESLDVSGASLDTLDQCAPQAAVTLCVVQPGTAPADMKTLLHLIRGNYPATSLACVFLASDDAVMAAAVSAGATGLIEETLLRGDLDPARLVDCIERVARGEFVASPAVALRLARLHATGGLAEATPSRRSQLTPREEEVLLLLAKGKSNRDIASDLSVSEHTIRSHVRGLMQKLQVTNRIQAAASAWREHSIIN